MSIRYDFIVIGAGHNGLTAAAKLAKAGRKVLVLERRANVGGAAATEELIPGFKFNIGAPDAGLLLPTVANELELGKHGLEFIESPVAAFAPSTHGRGLTLWHEAQRSALEIAAHSAGDARAFENYQQQNERFACMLANIAALQPPHLVNNSLSLLAAWGLLALKLRGLGGRDMMEFMRVLPMSAYLYLNEHFETDLLKGLIASTSITGLMQGPRASGTTFMLLYQQLGGPNGGFRSGRVVRGGIGNLSHALRRAAEANGAEVRTGVAITRILATDGKVRGVELADGEVIEAKAVLSSADPRTTFLGLLGAPELTPRISRRLRSLKLRGSTATVHLALNGLPTFTAASDPQRLSGPIVICPSVDYAERAFNDAKHGRLSEQPVLEARIPSLLDPSLAPSDRHAMTITVRYAPYKLTDSNWDVARNLVADRAIQTLAHFAPDLESQISDRHVITPLDYERDYGLAEGSEMHGQMGLDQLLLMRPVPGFVGYRSPIDGLYLCGAGAHPGGGVTGAPGYNAAKQAHKETR
jgi:phytoene dehydrogenase-like protein